MTANPRIILWVALAFVLYLNYEAWTRDYAPPPVVAPAAGAANGAGALGNSVPQAPATPAVEAPAGTPPAAAPSTAAPSAAPSSAAAPNAPSATEFNAAGPKVHVRTDVIDMDIALQGATIERADLLRYPKVKGQQELVRLMNTDPATLYLLRSGLFGPGNAPRPTQLANFTSPQSDYQLGSASELRVPFTWTDGNGVTVTKTFVFHPGSYRIDLQYAIENKSGAPWEAAP